MLKDWNFWLSIITLIGVLSGFYATWWQIKVSNKQKLFDMRLDVYLFSKKIVNLYFQFQEIDKKNNFSIEWYDLPTMFYFLTNDSFWKNANEVINGYANTISSNDSSDKFYENQEYLNQIVLKIMLLFNSQEAVYLSQFIACYRELLFSILQYKCDLEYIRREKERGGPNAIDKQCVELCEFDIHRQDLLNGLSDIKIKYDYIEKNDVMQKIEKQISLVKLK